MQDSRRAEGRRFIAAGALASRGGAGFRRFIGRGAAAPRRSGRRRRCRRSLGEMMRAFRCDITTHYRRGEARRWAMSDVASHAAPRIRRRRGRLDTSSRHGEAASPPYSGTVGAGQNTTRPPPCRSPTSFDAGAGRSRSGSTFGRRRRRWLARRAAGAADIVTATWRWRRWRTHADAPGARLIGCRRQLDAGAHGPLPPERVRPRRRAHVERPSSALHRMAGRRRRDGDVPLYFRARRGRQADGRPPPRAEAGRLPNARYRRGEIHATPSREAAASFRPVPREALPQCCCHERRDAVAAGDADASSPSPFPSSRRP